MGCADPGRLGDPNAARLLNYGARIFGLSGWRSATTLCAKESRPVTVLKQHSGSYY